MFTLLQIRRWRNVAQIHGSDGWERLLLRNHEQDSESKESLRVLVDSILHQCFYLRFLNFSKFLLRFGSIGFDMELWKVCITILTKPLVCNLKPFRPMCLFWPMQLKNDQIILAQGIGSQIFVACAHFSTVHSSIRTVFTTSQHKIYDCSTAFLFHSAICYNIYVFIEIQFYFISSAYNLLKSWNITCTSCWTTLKLYSSNDLGT